VTLSVPRIGDRARPRDDVVVDAVTDLDE